MKFSKNYEDNIYGFYGIFVRPPGEVGDNSKNLWSFSSKNLSRTASKQKRKKEVTLKNMLVLQEILEIIHWK